MNMNKQNDRDTIIGTLQVHLYSLICHLQVVSHGTIAFIYWYKRLFVLLYLQVSVYQCRSVCGFVSTLLTLKVSASYSVLK